MPHRATVGTGGREVLHNQKRARVLSLLSRRIPSGASHSPRPPSTPALALNMALARDCTMAWANVAPALRTAWQPKVEAVLGVRVVEGMDLLRYKP